MHKLTLAAAAALVMSLTLIGCGSDHTDAKDTHASHAEHHSGSGTAHQPKPDLAISPKAAVEYSDGSAVIEVYKSPTCGCCGKWVDHLRENGFVVNTHDHPDMSPVKDTLGVPGDVHSCHTAAVGPYVIEGHVPASDIQRLLKERPEINGLAVPGMPLGSPGMEHPQPENYATISFAEGKPFAVYQRHMAADSSGADATPHHHGEH